MDSSVLAVQFLPGRELGCSPLIHETEDNRWPNDLALGEHDAWRERAFVNEFTQELKYDFAFVGHGNRLITKDSWCDHPAIVPPSGARLESHARSSSTTALL